MDLEWYRKTKWFKKIFKLDDYRIRDIEKYLRGKSYTYCEPVRQKNLNVLTFPQSSLEKGVNNCSICSITRVVHYLADEAGNNVKTPQQLYADILDFAYKNGYTKKRGTPFYKIKKVFNYALSSNGLGLKPVTRLSFGNVSRNIYKSIDTNRPLLINIAFGFYANHTVTGVGYEEWQVKDIKGVNRKKVFVKIVDGWNSGTCYIDWDVFRKSASLGIGTFTLLK